MHIIDYTNNIIYNWRSPNAPYGGDMKIKGGVSQINMVNNYYIPGPATSKTLKFMQALHAGEASTGTGEWYLSGNIMEGDKNLTKDNVKGLDLANIPEADRSKAVSKNAFPITAALRDQSAKDAYKDVLANVGATLPKRDSVDTRVVNETRTKTATGMGVFGKAGIIDSPTAVGGWPVYNTVAAPVDTDHDGMPDDWEKKNKLDPKNAEDRNVVDKDGYTMLENYLNSLVTK